MSDDDLQTFLKNLTLDQLRDYVRKNNLNVKTNVGGKQRRTKQDIIDDILNISSNEHAEPPNTQKVGASTRVCHASSESTTSSEEMEIEEKKSVDETELIENEKLLDLVKSLKEQLRISNSENEKLQTENKELKKKLRSIKETSYFDTQPVYRLEHVCWSTAKDVSNCFYKLAFFTGSELSKNEWERLTKTEDILVFQGLQSIEQPPTSFKYFEKLAWGLVTAFRVEYFQPCNNPVLLNVSWIQMTRLKTRYGEKFAILNILVPNQKLGEKEYKSIKEVLDKNCADMKFVFCVGNFTSCVDTSYFPQLAKIVQFVNCTTHEKKQKDHPIGNIGYLRIDGGVVDVKQIEIRKVIRKMPSLLFK